MSNTKKVMVFGIFDELHDGHKNFLEQVKKYGNYIIAVVARDAAIEKIYGKKPKNDEIMRIASLLSTGEVDDIVMGHLNDKKRVFLEHSPDVIVLGFSQKELKEDLEKTLKEVGMDNVEIIIAEPYEPEKFPASEFVDKQVHL